MAERRGSTRGALEVCSSQETASGLKTVGLVKNVGHGGTQPKLCSREEIVLALPAPCFSNVAGRCHGNRTVCGWFILSRPESTRHWLFSDASRV